MKNLKELLNDLQGKSPEEQAAAISAYMGTKQRQKTVEESRRSIRAKIFANCKNMTKSQQEALIWEFLAANVAYVNGTWLKRAHPDLFMSDSSRSKE